MELLVLKVKNITINFNFLFLKILKINDNIIGKKIKNKFTNF